MHTHTATEDRRSIGESGGTVVGGGSAGRSRDSTSLDQLSASSLRSVAVLVCLVIVAGLGTWGVLVRRRSLRKMKSQSYVGIIGRGQESQTLSVSPSPGQYRLSVFKRK